MKNDSSNKYFKVGLVALALALAGCGEPPATSPVLAPTLREAPQALMYNGRDYLFVRSAVSWFTARTLCEDFGYGLVTTNDAAEESWLAGFQGSHSWWIGYNDIEVEGVWRWSHGSSSYTNWRPGQPDDGGNQDCAYDNWWNGQWDDGGCNWGAFFICESLQ